MKLFRVDFQDETEGLTHTWVVGRARAELTLLHLQRDARARGVAARGPERIEAVILPATRDGMVMWLNDHLVRSGV